MYFTKTLTLKKFLIKLNSMRAEIDIKDATKTKGEINISMNLYIRYVYANILMTETKADK